MHTHGSHDIFPRCLTIGLLGILTIGAGAFGCSSAPPASRSSATPHVQGSVRLQEIADWEFEASHPAAIDIATLESLLRGVLIAEVRQDMSNLPVDGRKPMRIFSDEDVRYLAPLLAHALSQAQPEYVVAFHLSSSAGSGSEPTAGTLYVKQDRLYLTVTEHRGTLAKVESSMFSDGRSARTAIMAQASDGQVEAALPAIAQGRQELKSLAIDYRRFTQQTTPSSQAVTPIAAPSSPMPVRMLVAATEAQPPGVESAVESVASAQDEALAHTQQELDAARQAMAKKDAKISALRRDLESMRTQLETRDKELRAVKSGKTAAPKRGTAELIR